MTTSDAPDIAAQIAWLDMGIENDTLINTKGGRSMLKAIHATLLAAQAMRKALKKSGAQFRLYETLHRAKPDHAKADANAEFAAMCEAAARHGSKKSDASVCQPNQTQTLIAAALHHLQADGAVDRKLLCDALNAANALVPLSLLAEVERLRREKAELLEWLVKLNKAIDSYWNAPRGLKLTGMGEIFLKEITEAQQQCKIVIDRATQQEPKS